jgi:tetratricopeptide (TPR) repeat protein
LAEAELRLALADDPDDSFAHALLALCLAHRKQFDPATAEAEQAVACGPDRPFAHYALATVRYHRNHYPEAEAAVREAIRLSPADPDYHSLLAAIRMEQQDWAGALAAADAGLEHDPEHAGCTNLRAMALVKLGRRAEAGAAIAGALERDPDDAFTHANKGWALLHDGEPTKALDHFREALRLDPELEFARAGMIEALKARYWVYRQVLRYFLWIGRLSPQARWGVVIGLLVLQRVVVAVGEQNPGLRPVLQPVLVAYLVFVVTTWTAGPLSNLFLRLNRFGRLALSADERAGANWVGVCAAAAVAGGVYGLVVPFPHDVLGERAALMFLILLLPLSGVFACERGWPRRVMAVYTAGMFAAGVTGLALLASGFYIGDDDPEVALDRVRVGLAVLRANLWAGFLSGFVANALMAVRPRV